MRMTTHAAKSALRIVSSNKIQRFVSLAAFYQQESLSGRLNFTTTEAQAVLLRAAEECHLGREWDALTRISDILIGVGDPLASIGQYYRALIVKRLGNGDVHESQRILDACSESLPAQYRSRSLLASAANAEHLGDRDASECLYLEAWRAGASNEFCDPKTVVSAGRILAYWMAAGGETSRALSSLDSILPLVKLASKVYPFVYYDYLGTTAVVLELAGRIQDAKAASDIVVGSPIASAYPNWTENHQRISRKLRRRDFVSVNSADDGATARGSLVSLSEWKEGRKAAAPLSVLPETVNEKRRSFLGSVMERELSQAEASAIFDSSPCSERLALVVEMVLRCDGAVEPAMRVLARRSGSWPLA
jgi:hypothetical protein